MATDLQPCPNQTTNQVCGQFSEPVNPDLGVCSPTKVKTDCEAPVLPTPQCGETFVTVYDPDATPKFKVTAQVFDQNCLPILDRDGLPIFTTIA